MTKQKFFYWTPTLLFSLWMIMNAYAYLTSPYAKQLCRHFGFPDYFRIELALAKIVGVIVLVMPFSNKNIKEWAYAGFTITVISGFIAHVCSGDSLVSASSALIAMGILLASYFSYNFKHTQK